MTGARRPRLCFAGPLGGARGGHVTTQSLVLSRLFAAAGYQVRSTSPYWNRFARLADTVVSLIGMRGQVDVAVIDVYSGRAFVIADAASLTARACGIPVILVLHGGNLPAFFEGHPKWARRVLERARLVVAPSRYNAAAAGKLGFAARVIPNVIEAASYPFRQREAVAPRLFWMRSFHPLYDPDLAIDVLERVRAHLPGATLVMAGQDKGALGSLEERVARQGLSGAVRFAGFLDHAGKLREFGSADIFLNTNRVDNMPVAVVEAAAMGLPVVATDVGGIAHLIEDGVTGLLAGAGDAEALAQAVLRLAGEPPLAASLSANGRRLAESCSWERVRGLWEEAFAELRISGAGEASGAGLAGSVKEAAR